jgi:predicted transposase YbfD/YdcC
MRRLFPPWVERNFEEHRDCAETLEKSRGRVECRKLTSTTILNDFLSDAWPDVAQVCQIVRTRTEKGETSVEVAYGITSTPRSEADAAQLLAWNRQHWHIENKLHYVRDETMGEDKCRIRSGSAPQILAGIRNAAITMLRALEIDNIAQALRKNAWHPQRLFAKLGITNN